MKLVIERASAREMKGAVVTNAAQSALTPGRGEARRTRRMPEAFPCRGAAHPFPMKNVTTRFKPICGRRLSAAALLLLSLAACHRDMRDQPRYEPYEVSDFYKTTSAREPVANTVARGQLNADSLLYTGRSGGRPAAEMPYPVSSALLARGQERYNIYCSPCHDRMGTGEGIIVQRGFRKPPSFHIERLRNAPPSYVFDVITNGFGAMYDYAAQVRPDDRWAIAAYVKALQLSQNAGVADVPAERRGDLDRAARFEEMLTQPSRGGGLKPPSEGGTGFADDPLDPERRRRLKGEGLEEGTTPHGSRGEADRPGGTTGSTGGPH